LGPVNLAALEELATASERKSFLDAQSADLAEAIGTLEDAIRRIDRETREQLQETYNTVNLSFRQPVPAALRRRRSAADPDRRRDPRCRHPDHGATAGKEEHHDPPVCPAARRR
jgi:uncharacterized protein YigA (DUF484 family)